MLAHGRHPQALRAIPAHASGYVRVHLGPGRQMQVPERAIRRWSADEPVSAVVVEADDRSAAVHLAQRRQAAFMRFARALLQSAGVPDVTERLTEIAAALRRR